MSLRPEYNYSNDLDFRSPALPGQNNFKHSVSTAATMATEDDQDDLTPRASTNMDEENYAQKKLAWMKEKEQEADDEDK